MTKIYTADVQWADGQWQGTVREVPGAHTYARTIPTLRKRLREVIVLMDGRADTDLHNDDAFLLRLAVQLTTTDNAGTTDSASVSVQPATSENREPVRGPAGKKTPTGSIKLSSGGGLPKATSGSIELGGGAQKTLKPSITGSIELGGSATLGRGSKKVTLLSGEGGLVAVPPPPPHEAIALAADLRERAEAAEEAADHATQIAILISLNAGIGMRDIATLLGLSHQRVGQIATEIDDVGGDVWPRRRNGKVS